jgi:hypothetical protein
MQKKLNFENKNFISYKIQKLKKQERGKILLNYNWRIKRKKKMSKPRLLDFSSYKLF